MHKSWDWLCAPSGTLRVKKQPPETDHGPKVLFLPESKFSERHEMSVRLKKQIVISLARDESLNSLARDDLHEIVS